MQQAEAKARAEAQNAIRKHFPLLTDFVREARLLPRDGRDDALPGTLRRGDQGLREFAGDNIKELTAVRVGSLTARLVTEDDAVSDRDAVLSAVGSLHCLPRLDRNLEAALRLSLEGIPFAGFGNITMHVNDTKKIAKKTIKGAASRVTTTGQSMPGGDGGDDDDLAPSHRAFEKAQGANDVAASAAMRSTQAPSASTCSTSSPWCCRS